MMILAALKPAPAPWFFAVTVPSAIVRSPFLTWAQAESAAALLLRVRVPGPSRVTEAASDRIPQAWPSALMLELPVKRTVSAMLPV